jgi:hypothetical protein
MELSVATSLGIRIGLNKKIIKDTKEGKAEKHKEVFRYGGPLGDCKVCGRCNMCKY